MTENADTPEKDREPAKDDKPGVIAHPPLIFAAGLLAGWLIGFAHPLPIGLGPWQEGASSSLILAGIGLIVWCLSLFSQAGTNVPTSRPSTVLVKTGPYKLSRNPIYIGLTLLHLGIAGFADSLWMALSLLIVLPVMHYGVVLREERYLERKFGEDYRLFKIGTSRWL